MYPNQYQQPQQYPPSYAPAYPQVPQPQPQYVQPAPQQYAAPAPAAAPQGFGLSAPGSAPSAGSFPRIADLEGRLLCMLPKVFEEKIPRTGKFAKPGETQDRMTVDIIVLDGAPFQFGGSDGKPHDKVGYAPSRFNGCYVNQTVLVSQLRDAYDRYRREGAGAVVGRLIQGVATQGNPPWKLADPTPDEIALAEKFLMNPTPNRIEALAPQQPQYQQPQAYLASPDPAAQYAPAAPAGLPPLPGWDPAVWATLPPAAQQQLHAAQAPGAGTPVSAAPGQPAPAPHPGWAGQPAGY